MTWGVRDIRQQQNFTAEIAEHAEKMIDIPRRSRRARR